MLSMVCDCSCFSSDIVQGYGLTETCAGGCVGDHDNRSPGRVGPPVPCCGM
jgi:long-chain acyl-CoA synthetase